MGLGESGDLHRASKTDRKGAVSRSALDVFEAKRADIGGNSGRIGCAERRERGRARAQGAGDSAQYDERVMLAACGAFENAGKAGPIFATCGREAYAEASLDSHSSRAVAANILAKHRFIALLLQH